MTALKTSGRTKTFEALENALALLCRARGEVAAMSAAIEGREAAFISGNPVLQEANQHLATALSLDGLTDKDANIIRAQQSIRAAVMVRAYDTGASSLRQRLLAFDQALEGQINSVRSLLGSMRSTDEAALPLALSAELMGPVGTDWCRPEEANRGVRSWLRRLIRR